MRANRLSTSLAIRCVPVRGYAAAAPKLEPEPEAEAEAESSTAAQRRLLRRTPPATTITSSDGQPKRRRGPKALALLRAQKLAEALKISPPPSNSTVPLSTSMITSPNLAPAPTLEDLEEKRPKRVPPTLLSPRYPRQYNKVYSSLDGAFTAKQLLKLAPKLGVRVPKGKGKGLAIKGILEAWGWDAPLTAGQQEQRIKREMEVVERDWELTKAEMWLLMRDTESLRPAMEQGVRFSIPPAGSERKVLRGTGQVESLEELDAIIREKREAIRLNTRSLDQSDDLRDADGLMGVIATTSGAYIEHDTDGRILISASSAQALEKAVSLLGQAVQHSTSRTPTSKAILTPSTDLELGLYPHLPAPNGSVPWQDIAQASKPLFRLQRVQPWEVKVGPRETVHVEEKLEEMPFVPIGGSDSEESITRQIARTVGSEEGSTTTIRFGHIAFPNTRSEGSPLTPPVHATWTPAQAAASQVVSGTPVFLPSLPPSLIHFPLEPRSTIKRELQYRHQDGRILYLSYDVPETTNATTSATETSSSESQGGWHKELDEYMDRLNIEDPGSEGQEITVQARLSSGKTMEVMMPDRPIDLGITSSMPNATVTEELISGISPYLRDPAGLPPSTIQHDESEWQLLSAQELEIFESDLSTQTPDLDLPMTPILLRTVRATDLTFGGDRTLRYAELETEGEVSPAFWAELARVTRVLAPGAGALRGEIY